MHPFAIRHIATVACMAAAALVAAPNAAAQGTVNALCSTDAGWCEAAAAAFTRETGIRVLQAHKGTGEIGAQLRAEAANPKTDIWWGGTGDPFLQAAEQGLLEPYRPAYINDLHDWAVRQYALSQNMVGGFYTSAMGFGFNTDLLKKKKLPEPKCWADLIKPEYKGEIEISHPASSGTAYTIIAGLVQQMGEDAAFDYLKKLNRNVTSYTRSGQAQAPNVAKGEVAIGGTVGSLQSPANKTFKPDPRIPSMAEVKLIKYDFEKYGKADERKRLIDRWTREVESQPR